MRTARSIPDDTMARLPADVGDSRCRQLLVWWQAARGGRPWPTRPDFDPILFPRLLPHLFLCDVMVTPQVRFVYRLTGTEIDHLIGINGAGRPHTDLPIHDDANSHWEQFNRTLEGGVPTYLEHGFVTPGKREVEYRRLLLPLSRTGLKADLLLGLLVFTKVWEHLDDDGPPP